MFGRSSFKIGIVAGIALSLALAPAAVRTGAADEISSEQAAARLSACTVTVRMLSGKAAAAPAEKSDLPDQRAPGEPHEKPDRPALPESVTVSSGVCVAPRLVVTFVRSALQAEEATSRFRVTLPDGEQARATLRVVDRYSGLILLEVAAADLAHLTPAEGVPKVGSLVLTAAAAGIEKPLVSLGILSGLDRSPGNTGLPPLLECDVRTTDTSSGAAIVDREAGMLGIIVATPPTAAQAGWTYAIPARHVARLLAAKSDARQPAILERRRPSLGLTMAPGAREGTVEVEHVVPGGPADKAGIRRGDVIVEAAGRKIRSAYQAVDLILTRQPGDTLPLVVVQGAERKQIDVVLAGQTAALATAAPDNLGPQVKVRVVGPRQIEVEKHAGEVGFGGTAAPSRGGAAEELEMLKIQLSAFEKVIARLQAELERREAQQAASDELLESLRRQVELLRRQNPDADRQSSDREPPASKAK